MKQISKVDKIQSTYNGEYRDGCYYENYKYIKGDKIEIADAYVNARNIMSAINKLAKKLGLCTYNDMEDLEDALDSGYCYIEETNNYNEEDDTTYKYYVSINYAL